MKTFTQIQQLKLGAILGRRDPRMLQLAHYLDQNALPEPMDNINWDTGSESCYRMRGNDKVGDCVVVAAHNFNEAAAHATGDPWKGAKTDDGAATMAIKDYSAVSGYDPATGANDNGLDPEEFLKWASKHAGATKSGKIVAYGAVNRKDMKECRQALEIFGNLYTALALPKTAQAEVGKVWTYHKLPTLSRIPNSWGGHMVSIRHIDATTSPERIWCVTWAKTQEMTREFFDHYCSATYFYITEKWIADTTGKTPSGFDLPTLLADAKRLKA